MNHLFSGFVLIKFISTDIVLILSIFFVAVEVKVRNITKHLRLSPDVSRCDSW